MKQQSNLIYNFRQTITAQPVKYEKGRGTGDGEENSTLLHVNDGSEKKKMRRLERLPPLPLTMTKKKRRPLTIFLHYTLLHKTRVAMLFISYKRDVGILLLRLSRDALAHTPW